MLTRRFGRDWRQDYILVVQPGGRVLVKQSSGSGKLDFSFVLCGDGIRLIVALLISEIRGRFNWKFASVSRGGGKRSALSNSHYRYSCGVSDEV